MMKHSTFRFYSQLNDFLHLSQRGKIISVSFQGRQSVKHLIEALRVPHTEVGDIHANGASVELSYLVCDGDHISVYPVANGYPGANSTGEEENAPCFVLDNHLGRLARYLRMLGFDTLYCNDYQDDELARISEHDGRILLTRDRGLLMRKVVTQGYCVRSKDPEQQFAEVAERFDLFGRLKPFQRCLSCNSPLHPVAKEDIIDRLQPLTKKYYHEFRICLECDQVYWKGSHYRRMEAFLSQVRTRT
jgi:uncharacterized protein with PIN domain